MKKREFNSRLHLGKNIISTLQTDNLRGGTDGIVQATTYVIINTIKITIEHFTKPRVCPVETSEGCPPSHDCGTNPPSCVRTACDFNC